MTYIDGFVIACSKERKQDFIDHAKQADPFFMEHGALRVVEAWGEDVPEGKTTDFRMAVKAEPGEAVLFSWIEWPDKATRDACFAEMMAESFSDPRMDQAKNPMPFDGTRMIFGGFVPVLDLQRELTDV